MIWVFAGGGEAELRGLDIFLKRNFPFYSFERKTPIFQKPGPRPDRYHAVGHTGTALRQQIHWTLEQALRDGRCDCILILDDLDCHDIERSRQIFDTEIQRVAGAETIRRIIAFAAPELEAWLIADWSNSFASHRELRQYEVKIRRALADAYQTSTDAGNINHPEGFSVFNAERNTCEQKLSEKIIEVVRSISGITYSKDEHSGSMLQKVQAEIIQRNCPIFRHTLYVPLSNLTQ